jgi:hypothetical protein
MSARYQPATQVEHAAFYSSDLWVELSCDLQYTHYPAGGGPTSDRVTL